MSFAFSPAGCCCCPELDDFCTACGAEVDLVSRYEVIVLGMAQCDPPTSQSCPDCSDYDGTYVLDFAGFSTGSLFRRCTYRYVLPEPTCNQGGAAVEWAVSKVELQVLYGRVSESQCITVLEGIITADQLSVTVKGQFRRQLPGLRSCRELVGVELLPHPNQIPCSPNVVCDFSQARMVVSWLE